MPQKGVTILFTLKKGNIMSENTQEQQLKENHRNLKEERAAHFKYALNFCFRNIVSPGP
jgi:hypothetical protein